MNISRKGIWVPDITSNKQGCETIISVQQAITAKPRDPKIKNKQKHDPC